jgi:hypothetical protein
MFNAFLISLALGSVYQPSQVAFVAGNINVGKGKVIILPETKAGYYYSVNVRGLSQGGDIDCAIMQKNPNGQGYVFKYLDEDNANKCSFGFYATSNETYKLWLINFGNVDDAFDVSVSQ